MMAWDIMMMDKKSDWGMKLPRKRAAPRNVLDRPPTLLPRRSNELAKQTPCYWKRRNLVKTILLKTVVIKDKRQCGISHNEAPVVSRPRQLQIEHPTTRPHLETTWETWIHSLMDSIVRFLPKSLLLQVVDAVVLLVLMVVHLLPLVEVHHELLCTLRLVAVPRVLLHRVRVRLMLATLLPETTMMNKMTNTLLDFMMTVMIP
mmetsp:Transcript_12140/g.22072  ORF Transcript_12140/g.22072 Transcript_12140/m.22072 type:complete len:203 (+) Transcript_12140:294-902(+)